MIRNITDVDDKIIRRVSETGDSVAALTDTLYSATYEMRRRWRYLSSEREQPVTLPR